MQFHLTPVQVGLVFLSGPLCCMFLSLVAGQLSDKFVSVHTDNKQFFLSHGNFLSGSEVVYSLWIHCLWYWFRFCGSS